MQISIIFWPQASAWARRYRDDDGVEKMLAQFADAHRVAADPYARPAKRFREAA